MFFNDAITSSKFPSSLKMTIIKAVFRKRTKSLKVNKLRYKQYGLTPHFSNGQNLLKKNTERR